MRIGQTSVVSFLSQVVSSVVGFVATVYLANILGADVLGTYFLVVAVVIWLQVVGGLGVQSAITKRLSERNADDAYLTAGGLLLFGIAAVLSVALFGLSDRVSAYVGVDVVGFIVLLLFTGMALKFVMAALRGQHKVHIAAFLRPVDRTTRSVLQIAAAALSFGLVGILVGYAIGGLVATLVGLTFLSVGVERPTREHFERIVSYAQYSWLGKLGSRTFSSMDTLVLGIFVSSNLIGFYEIAWNLASILAVFGVAIAQAMFPEISRLSSEDAESEVRGMVNDAVAYSGLLLIPGLAGCIVVGDLVLAVYGSEFQRAYSVLIVLVSARLVYAYGNQFVSTLNAVDRPDLAFRVNGVFVATNVTLNLVLVAAIGWIGAAIATTVSAVATLLFGYYHLSRLVDVPIPYGELFRQGAAAAVMGATVYGARQLVGESLVATAGLVALGGAVYSVSLLAISTRLRNTVRRNLSSAPV